VCLLCGGRHIETLSGQRFRGWQRWQQKLPKEKRFAERSLRNLVGSEDDLQTASERLGHASTATTKKFYRNKPTEVLPLSSHKTG